MIAVSMNSGLGKYEQTMSRMDGFCEQPAEKKSELMLYPERVICGHCNFGTRKLCGDSKSALGVSMLLSEWCSVKNKIP